MEVLIGVGIAMIIIIVAIIVSRKKAEKLPVKPKGGGISKSGGGERDSEQKISGV